jgi:hypothetical protein
MPMDDLIRFGQRCDELAVNSNWSAFPYVLTMNNYFFCWSCLDGSRFS